MNNLDARFELFAKTIQRIFRSNCSDSGFTSTRLAQTFISEFEENCPTLANSFPKKPSFLYTLDVIDFAVDGMGDALLKSLWEARRDVEGYSIHTIRKRSQKFGIQVAKHLFGKEAELTQEPLPKVHPVTLQKYLAQTYDLSRGQINVLLAYSQTVNRGRKQIARDLGLADNTIKSHVHRIMHKMNTLTINEAVEIVRKYTP